MELGKPIFSKDIRVLIIDGIRRIIELGRTRFGDYDPFCFALGQSSYDMYMYMRIFQVHEMFIKLK